jgi:GT2 family glycosyltransferase
VLGQTFGDFELLVIGDACTDDSEEVVNAVADARVRWINLPANTGHQSGPNNRGLEEARGEFIAYLGHDDLWFPHHLACMVDGLVSSGADMGCSLLARVAPGRDVGSPAIPQPRHGNIAPPSCTMYRRSVTERIGGWRDYRGLYAPPEVDLWHRARAAGFQSVFVPRLTAVKFPASARRNVYRSRPCHEQQAWLQRIKSERDLEAVALVQMIVAGEAAAATPAHWLVSLLSRKLLARLAWGLSRKSGRGLFWRRKGAGIDRIKRFKGL